MMIKLIRKLISLTLAVIVIIPSYAIFMTWTGAHYSKTALQADVIVVPGAAQLNGIPGEVLLARLQEAKRVKELGIAPIIITVGSGAPGDRTTEAASGRAWLIRHGIKKSSVIALNTGRDTQAQTQAYVDLMKSRNINRVAIATDPYHCRRAMVMANDAGLVATCSPVTSGPNSLQNSHLRYLIRESGAYLAYIFLGRRGVHISDHLPATNLITSSLKKGL